MKYLVVAGCSHVVGTGLDKVFGDKIFRKKRWSSLLAKQLKLEEINLGKDGGSNWDIYFTLMSWITSNYLMVNGYRIINHIGHPKPKKHP